MSLAFGERLTDDFDWTVNSGSTRSEQTGPDSGYNGYGKGFDWISIFRTAKPA